MNFYSPNGLGNTGLYQASSGLQGYSTGGMYAAAAPPPAPSATAAVSYRAPTPPHTPSTQVKL